MIPDPRPHRQAAQASQKTAVVFGPVAPTWAGGAFCAPLVQVLEEAGFAVHVIDSIPLLLGQEAASEADILAQYAAQIMQDFGQPDLIAGYAYGGTLAMALAPMFANAPDIISVSGPGFADEPLQHQLGAMIVALKAGNLSEALTLLAQSVAPRGTTPKAMHLDTFEGAQTERAIARMIAGFAFLLRLDVRARLARYDGRLLALTGEFSNLATAQTLGFDPVLRPQFSHVEIPNAGMRVLLEDPETCVNALKKWICHD